MTSQVDLEIGKHGGEMETGSQQSKSGEGKPRLIVLWIAIAAVGGFLLGAGIVNLVSNDDGDDDSRSEEPVAGGARIVSASELRQIAAAGPAPIYWAGEQPGTRLELSEEENGNEVFVRYLSQDAGDGDAADDFLTVGTYAVADPAASLAAYAKSRGGKLRKLPGGGTFFVDPQRPSNVYVVKPDSAYEIEIYDPDPKRALSLALSDRLQPVDGQP